MDYDAGKGQMDCFVCNEKKMIKLNFEKNFFRCPCCDNSGGVLHLYAKVALGIPSPKGMPKKEFGKVSDALEQFMEGSASVSRSDHQPSGPKEPRKPKIAVAEDAQLHRIYSALLTIPALALIPSHREELMRRGLDDEAIQRNAYRSIPENYHVPDYYWTMYKDNGGEIRRRNNMGWITAYQIRFGLMVAHAIISQGLNPQGVPGFFKFGNVWCFLSIPGILIPTRNRIGQIVVFQVRRDKLIRKKDSKYKTVGASALPNHVSTEFSRCHFPLGNAPLSKNNPVFITEGPLKADIACHLYGKPAIFAAIPGVTTRNDLLRNCRAFKKAGIWTVYNALDMDKVTNRNVRRGEATLSAELKKRGITLQNLFWDSTYAISKLLMFTQVAKLRNVSIPVFSQNTSVFDQLRAVSIALETAGIYLCEKKISEKEVVKYHWNPDTKGIDDYLLNRKHK
jgi:hypothetical protein